jgi:hypothetical protein
MVGLNACDDMLIDGRRRPAGSPGNGSCQSAGVSGTVRDYTETEGIVVDVSTGPMLDPFVTR